MYNPTVTRSVMEVMPSAVHHYAFCFRSGLIYTLPPDPTPPDDVPYSYTRQTQPMTLVPC